MARDVDLLLSIFPFEKEWYARRTPSLRVEFVGHPMIEIFSKEDLRFAREQNKTASIADREPQILLLPGSRADELRRHLPVMLGALKLIRAGLPASIVKIVLPNEALAQLAKSLGANVEIQIGDLPQALPDADLAIAATGTVTMECAYFGVPTVALYKTSWSTYQIVKRIIKVKFLAMPNLLADEEIFPEFIQQAATPENISRAALDLLMDPSRRTRIKTKLAEVITALGAPGASRRAAETIAKIL
jgi:lipid-A-disaccharide synthase